MQRQFMQTLVEIIDQIKKEQTIHREQLQALLETTDEQAVSYLRDTARKVADDIYGKQVFIRGLIEFTNYCKNDCIYCGILPCFLIFPNLFPARNPKEQSECAAIPSDRRRNFILLCKRI